MSKLQVFGIIIMLVVSTISGLFVIRPQHSFAESRLAGTKIAFVSTRDGNEEIYTMNADGSDLRQLSFNAFNDFNPSVLHDGRIIYSRWEYNERSVTSLHHPFTIFPDGTMMSPYYGNATIRPNVVMFPRPVPGSTQVMALFTAHHGQTHGPIGLIDRRRGVDGPEALTLLTPHLPVTGEKAEDSRYGWYSDPQPLSASLYLCSYVNFSHQDADVDEALARLEKACQECG